MLRWKVIQFSLGFCPIIKNAKRIIELSLQQGLDEDYIINFAHEVTDLSVEELKKIYDETVNITAG